MPGSQHEGQTPSGHPYNRPLHVLIVDSHSSANRGDAAILTTMMEALREVIEGVQFKVHSNYPEVTASVHGVAAAFPLFESRSSTGSWLRTYRALAGDGEQRSLLRRVPRLSRRLWDIWVGVVFVLKVTTALIVALPYRLGCRLDRCFPFSHWEAWVDYCQADLITAPGGTNYTDNYWPGLPGLLMNLLYAKVLSKPVAISSHSFGPFRRKFYRAMARFVFEQLDLVCCRHEHDVHVLRDLGVKSNRIHVTADTAWLLQAASRERALEILVQEAIDWPEPATHVSISAVRWWRHDGSDARQIYERYVTCLAEVLDRLISEQNVSLFFVSTCTSLGGMPMDDRLVADDIRARMEQADRLSVLRGEYSAEELKAVYGLMDLHIGTRMHSNILAAAMGVPIVALANEAKAPCLMDSLNLAGYCLDNLSLTTEALWGKVTMALEHRQQLRSHLLHHTVELQRRARLNAKYSAQLLRTHPGLERPRA